MSWYAVHWCTAYYKTPSVCNNASCYQWRVCIVVGFICLHALQTSGASETWAVYAQVLQITLAWYKHKVSSSSGSDAADCTRKTT
jgi:hypothetical protein